MESLLKFFNCEIDSLKAGNGKKIIIRRITFADILVDDKLIVNPSDKETLKDLMEQKKDIKEKISIKLKNNDYSDHDSRDKLAEIEKELSKIIERAVFSSNKTLSLTTSGDIVYTSKYLMKSYFEMDLK